MKFWELTSAFREEKDILELVLNQDKWRKYYESYRQLKEIVQKQQRHILDEKLPFDLCYEVAEKSKQEYWLAFEKQPQILYSYRPNIENLERLVPSEILIRFGGDKIEDAQERSETYVEPKPLNGNAEAIGSYNLSWGLLSIIRTEKVVLTEHCNLSTIDGTKQWKVKSEYKNFFVDPYEAYEKVQAMLKQNIRQYFLNGINHSDKPKPGELLLITKNIP